VATIKPSLIGSLIACPIHAPNALEGGGATMGAEGCWAKLKPMVDGNRSRASSGVLTFGTALQAGGHRFDPGTLHLSMRGASS
jgi:hypothetical protein